MKRKGAGYHHGDLRRALVEATIRLVDARGTEGFTLRAAAQLAGVSDGAPYHHFEDKDALLAAAAERSFHLAMDDMQAAAVRQRGDVRKKSLAIGVAYVVFAAKHPARFRLMSSPMVRDRRYPDLVRTSELAQDVLRAAIARGLGASDPRHAPKHLLLSAWSLIHGLSMLAVEGQLGDHDANPRRLERLVWNAVGLIDAGYRQEAPDADAGVPSSRSRLRTDRVPGGLYAKRG